MPTILNMFYEFTMTTTNQLLNFVDGGEDLKNRPQKAIIIDAKDFENVSGEMGNNKNNGKLMENNKNNEKLMKNNKNNYKNENVSLSGPCVSSASLSTLCDESATICEMSGYDDEMLLEIFNCILREPCLWTQLAEIYELILNLNASNNSHLSNRIRAALLNLVDYLDISDLATVAFFHELWFSTAFVEHKTFLVGVELNPGPIDYLVHYQEIRGIYVLWIGKKLLRFTWDEIVNPLEDELRERSSDIETEFSMRVYRYPNLPKGIYVTALLDAIRLCDILLLSINEETVLSQLDWRTLYLQLIPTAPSNTQTRNLLIYSRIIADVFFRHEFDDFVTFETIEPNLRFSLICDGICHLIATSGFDEDFLAEITPLVVFNEVLFEEPRAILVGVEPNPGPNYNFILKVLKNLERETDVRASCLKRTNCVSAKHQRMLEKKKTLAKKCRRFCPEGVFNVGLDNETKEFMTDIMRQIGEVVGGGMDLKIDWTTNITTSFIRILDYCKEHFTFIFDYIRFVFSLVYEFFQERADEIFGPLFRNLFDFQPEGCIDSAFLLYMYRDTLGKYFGNYDIIGISKLIAQINSEGKNLTGAMGWLLSIIKEVTVALNTWFKTGIPVFSGDVQLDRYFEAFYVIKKRFEEPGASHYHIAQDLYILHDAVERYYRESTIKDEREKILYLLRLMKPVVQHCETTVNPNNGPRIEPLAICITGPSGVGKSSFTTPIMLAFLARLLPKDRRGEFMSNHNEFLFFRANENDFWDGYRSSHEAIIFDDFGQRKDIAGGDNMDAFELIRLKNTAPYHLHFSSITDKQKNYANPRFLFCTTNRNTLRFNSIVCNEAVVRRFDIAVVQVPRLEFCVDGTDKGSPWERRLDEKKVRAQYPFSASDCKTYLIPEVIEFIEWDFTTGWPKVSGRTFTFEELIDEGEKIFNKIQVKGDAMLDYHRYIKERFMPEGASSCASSEIYEDCATLEEDIRRLFDDVPTPQKLFPNNWKIVASIFGAFATFISVGALFNKLTRISADSASNIGFRDKNVKLKGKTRVHRRNPRAAFKGVKLMKTIQAEGSGEEYYNLLVKLVRRNFYLLRVSGKTVGNILFVKGRTCIYPSHYNTLIEDKEDMTAELVDVNGVCQYRFDWSQNMDSYAFDFDLEALRIPGIREHADISKMFVSESAVHDADCFEAMLPVFRGSTMTILEPQVKFGHSRTYRAGGEEYLSNRLEYIAATIPGDCGSPLVCYDKRFGGPTILGVHTAGYAFSVGRKACIGAYLSSEDLSMCLEAMDEDFCIKEQFECALGFNNEGFSTMGKARPPRYATKSKLEPSMLFDRVYEHNTKPAMLHPFVNEDGERKDPAKIAQFKYCNEPVVVSNELIHTASIIVDKRVLRHHVPKPWEPRLWTIEEAVGGIPGVDYCGSIDRSTSAGYPHNLNHSNGKKSWLGSTGPIDINNPAALPLKEMILSVIEDAKCGIRQQHIYMDCLKDERRPIAKVEAGKTRQFMACPIQLLVAIRMYFGDFIRHICSNKIMNGISVGINATSEEWSALYSYLHVNDKYVHGAGDYAAFDCKLHPAIVYKFLECCETYYAPTATEEDRRVRRILFLDVVNSIHIDRDGNIYEFNGKNPSGQPATAVMNSYVNAIMLVSCWIHLGVSPEDIEKYFRWNTFGDDHVTGFPIEFEDKAGTLALAGAMKSLFDYEYTDEAKSGHLVNTKPMSEIQYLKRSFRYNGQNYDAPLEIGVLKETLNWQKSGVDIPTLHLRFDCWFVELARHGKSVFAECAPPMIKEISFLYNYVSPFSIYENARNSDVLFGPSF